MRTARTYLLRYGAAIALTGATTLLIFAVKPFLVRGIMVLYIPAVMSSAWYGGLGPGLVTTVLSVGITAYYFLDPYGSFAIQSGDDIAELAVFSLVALLTSILNTAQKRAQQALLDNQRTVHLMFDVTRAANEAENSGQALRFAVHRLCEEGQWAYVQLYLPGRSRSDPWQLSGDYHAIEEPRFEPVRAAYLSRTFRRGHGPAAQALESGQVEWADDVRVIPANLELARAGVRTVAAFPVRVGSETIAVFECHSLEAVQKTETLVHLLGVVGLELGRVVERQRLQKDYSEAVWEQQRVIAQELHDGLGQELTGLGFMSQSLSDSLSQPEQARAAARLTEGLKRALEQIRGLARGVSPVAPEPDGLVSALSQLAESASSAYKVGCRFDSPKKVLVDIPQVAVHLYRIAQEAVTNAAKHGRPSRISILLESTPEGVQLSVSDDGSGIPKGGPAGGGSGLRIMRYRAAAIGASLRVEAGTGGGTRVTCLLPEPGARSGKVEVHS